jgi:phthalate 4,5-cis-dihydrodiol dehydrogenase
VTVRLGVAGLGTAGAVMLGAAFAHEQVAVAAVADSDRGAPVADGDGLRRYDSVEGLLADRAVDAVHIATPTPLHFAHVSMALEAGKHVIVEKPVTATLAEAEELAARAAAADRVVIVGHSEAFEPYVQAVRAAICSGAIGTPTLVLAEKFTDWMRRPRLPEEWDAAAGGGLILRQGIHQLDVVRTVTGATYSVRGARVRADPEHGGPGTYAAWLDGDGGESAVLVHDGIGRLSPAGEHGPGSPPLEGGGPAAKRVRRHQLLRHVLATRTAPRIGAGDRERLLVLGTGGEIVASSGRVEVRTAAGRREVSLAGFPGGRQAVLDELAGAVTGTRPVIHDLAWGVASLRTCTEIGLAAMRC